jgi:hypothetical protein
MSDKEFTATSWDRRNALIEGNVTPWKIIKKIWRIIKSQLRKQRTYSRLSMLAGRLLQDLPLPNDFLSLGKMNIQDWYIHINLPFRFHEEKKLIAWWEKLQTDLYADYRSDLEITRFDKSQTIGTAYFTKNDRYGSWPYATRTYKIYFEGDEWENVAFVFDSRLEGSTCEIQMVEEGQKAIDPVMEIVCGDALEEPTF